MVFAALQLDSTRLAQRLRLFVGLTEYSLLHMPFRNNQNRLFVIIASLSSFLDCLPQQCNDVLICIASHHWWMAERNFQGTAAVVIVHTFPPDATADPLNSFRSPPGSCLLRLFVSTAATCVWTLSSTSSFSPRVCATCPPGFAFAFRASVTRTRRPPRRCVFLSFVCGMLVMTVVCSVRWLRYGLLCFFVRLDCFIWFTSGQEDGCFLAGVVGAGTQIFWSPIR